MSMSSNIPISTVLKVIWRSIKQFFVERPGRIIGSAFILIMLWGFHGNLALLGKIWPAWRGPGIDLAAGRACCRASPGITNSYRTGSERSSLL